MPEPTERLDFTLEPVDPLTWTPPRFLRRHAARTARRRALRRLLVGGLTFILGFGFLVAYGGLGSILWRRLRIHRLEAQVAALEERKQRLEAESANRRKDRATIERLAREEYGLIYPGETLVRVLQVSEAEARQVEKAREEQRRAREAAAEDVSQR